LRRVALGGQPDAVRAGPVDQLPDQLVIQQIRRGSRTGLLDALAVTLTLLIRGNFLTLVAKS
jgi:hypothetical protein